MEDIKRVVIDTNLLVRYLTDDDEEKSKAVYNLLSRAETGELRILLPSIVIAELVWVLESFYNTDSGEISELVQAIINTPGVEVTEKSTILSALKLYESRNLDFIDALIIEFAKEKNATRIYTFDRKHFKGIEGIEITRP